MAGRDMYGELVHLEAASADAHTNAAVFAMYNAGSLTARVLLASEWLTITDVVFHSAAGGTYTLSFGASAAGRLIAKGTVGVTSGLAHHFETPRSGPKGVMPVLLAAVGVVDCVLCGYIQKT